MLYIGMIAVPPYDDLFNDFVMGTKANWVSFLREFVTHLYSYLLVHEAWLSKKTCGQGDRHKILQSFEIN